jgi:hypothetical protein
LEAEDVSSLQFQRDFSRKRPLDASADQEILAWRARFATVQPIGGQPAAFGNQGYMDTGLGLHIPANTVPSVEVPFPA